MFELKLEDKIKDPQTF